MHSPSDDERLDSFIERLKRRVIKHIIRNAAKRQSVRKQDKRKSHEPKGKKSMD
jgi:hypothetical protein